MMVYCGLGGMGFGTETLYSLSLNINYKIMNGKASKVMKFAGQSCRCLRFGARFNSVKTIHQKVLLRTDRLLDK